jgi:glutamine synthetase
MNKRRRIRVEYVWLDGGNPQKLRSKTKILFIDTYSDELDIDMIQLPNWTYDGSSTGQGVTEDSEIVLVPRTKFKDPFEGDIIVMCDTYYSNGEPEKHNKRHLLESVVKEKDQKTWYGFEQEYFMFNPKTEKPLGWPKGGFPGKQGDYYCGVGNNHVSGRHIANMHLEKCLEAGLNISGINAEVAKGQWEYQLGPVTALEGSDALWISRYILYRIGEIYGVEMNIDPKPYEGDEWNGSGCHVNFSTKDMRDVENIKSGKTIELIDEACKKLEKAHNEHIEVYGIGNEKRLTGSNETASFKEFKYGVGNRAASIRIPIGVERKEVGYLEDRRPSSNVDPYLVVRKLIETIC